MEAGGHSLVSSGERKSLLLGTNLKTGIMLPRLESTIWCHVRRLAGIGLFACLGGLHGISLTVTLSPFRVSSLQRDKKFH